MKNLFSLRVVLLVSSGHVVRRIVKNYPDYHVVTLDKLTYAGNLENLQEVENAPNHTFIKGDILDVELLKRLFDQYAFDGVIHLAAESHVDRSLEDPSVCHH